MRVKDGVMNKISAESSRRDTTQPIAHRAKVKDSARSHVVAVV